MANIELEILNFIRDNLSNPILDAVMPVITYLGSGGAVWIVLTVIMLISGKNRKIGAAMTVALILSLIVCNGILKPLASRIRPYELVSAQLLIAPPMGASFPSGHASAAFAAAITLVLSRHRLASAAVIMAVLIAFSRMYLYVHYLSDVLAGAGLGTLLAVAACKITDKVYDKIISCKKRVEK